MLPLVSELASACMQAILHTNAVPNMDKLEFTYIVLDDDDQPKLVAVDVPHFKTRTLVAPPPPPLIVGVPIFHDMKPSAKLADLLATFRSVCHSVRGKDMAPLLTAQSFVAFALSRSDYMFFAVLSPPEWEHELQVYAHKAYKNAFALPR